MKMGFIDLESSYPLFECFVCMCVCGGVFLNSKEKVNLVTIQIL